MMNPYELLLIHGTRRRQNRRCLVEMLDHFLNRRSPLSVEFLLFLEDIRWIR